MPGPKAKSDGLTAMQVGAQLVVLDRGGRECARLDAAQATVWAACDGNTDIAALATLLADRHDIAPDREKVFGILDALADAGLLERRVAPPGRLSSLPRRDLFARAMSGAAAALAVASPTAALAQLSLEQEAKVTQERDQKQAQERDAKLTQEEDQKRTQEQSQKSGTHTDVPEPASAALVASGVLASAVALGYRRRRQGQAASDAGSAEAEGQGAADD